MSKEKIVKTNAMRILDLKKINYEIISYESKEQHKIWNNIFGKITDIIWLI